jgi:hypothetical protein
VLKNLRTIRSTALLAGILGLTWGLIIPNGSVQAQASDPATLLYVRDIWVGWVFETGSNRIRPYAVVDVVDGNGWPVDDALVLGNWSGLVKETGDSALTQTDFYLNNDGTVSAIDGEAKIWASKTGSGQGKLSYFIFTVSGVSKQGMNYVPVTGMTTASAPNRAP